METTQRKRIAVVGAGVAGIVAAYLLSRKHDVTLFEKNDYIGGHTRTVSIPNKRLGALPVDTGFMIFNDRTYPLFTRFLDQLGVETGNTDISFSYTDIKARLQYTNRDFSSIFKQLKNIFSPSMSDLLTGIIHFNDVTREKLYDGALAGLTIHDHLIREEIADIVVESYVLPLAGAIRPSAAKHKIPECPAEAFARFYDNHGLFDLSHPRSWRYVEGGSQNYVRAFLKIFEGRVFPSGAVENIFRTAQGVLIKMKSYVERFDRVVIATHANQALAMLAEPTDDEKRLLSVWTYEPGRVVLHRDESFLPPGEVVRTAWNFVRTATAGDDAPSMLTYDMTLLQNLPTRERICITLNPWKHVAPEAIIREASFDHPVFDLTVLRLQKELTELNGRQDTFFCGSYFGAGLHEDAVRSAVEVGKLFGIEL